MKKYLACAGAVSCMCVFNAFAYHDHGGDASRIPEGVSVAGFLDFQSAYTNQDVARDGRRETTFLNDSEIHIRLLRTAESGLRYGAVIELEADVTEDFRDEGLNADKTYLFAEGGFGRLELGANSDAGHRLQIDAATFARATGGIHGDWFYYVFFPAGAGGGHHAGHNSFLHFPALPLHHAHGVAEDATKITYFTPQYHGVQAGVSYLPDSGDSGTAAGFSGKTGHRDFNDVLNGGIAYEGKAKEAAYRMSFTGETGRSELPGHENLGAWAAGTNLEYKGFVAGGSYGDWNQSITHITPANSSAHYVTLGAGYDMGGAGVSLTWFRGEYQRNETEVLSLGADFTPLPGFTPYVELSQVILDASDPTIQDNEGVVVLVGAQVGF